MIPKLGLSLQSNFDFNFQSLDEHRSSVCQVRWNRGPTFKHVADRMTLATSDMSGQIIVWNAMTVRYDYNYQLKNLLTNKRL